MLHRVICSGAITLSEEAAACYEWLGMQDTMPFTKMSIILGVAILRVCGAEDALEHFTGALKILQRVAPDSVLVAGALRNVAAALRQLGRLKLSEASGVAAAARLSQVSPFADVLHRTGV